MHRKKSPIDKSRFQHLYPFASHYVSAGGLSYHYVDEGEGEPIVMVHGNPTWSFYFRELIKGLCPEFRTIAPDHIGCGLSDKPDIVRYDYRLASRVDDLENLLDAINLKKKITLLLHDWGGMIGMAYAVRHPDRIGRIVLMNTAAFLPLFQKKLPIRLRIIRNHRWLANPAVLGLNLFVVGALFMAPNKRLAPEVRAGLAAPYNCRRHRTATLKFVQDIPVCDSDPSYGLVKHVDERLHLFSCLPVLICWGLRDFVFDVDYLKEWKRRFSNARIHTFTDAGHYLLEDAPHKVLYHVRRFLDDHPLT